MVPVPEAPDAQQLAAALLSEIGEGALEVTGGDRYRSGQPLLSDPSAPSAPSGPPAEQGKEAPPATPPPATVEGADWFLPGLYKTQEDAIRGVHETKRYASEAVDRAKATEAELSRMREALMPKQVAPDPLAEMENYGVPREPLQTAIEAVARQSIEKMFAPMQKRIEADQKIVELFPEYQPKFSELAAFVDSQPELKEKVVRAEAAGEFLLARELAWLNYERSKVAQESAVVASAATHRENEAKRTMADAMVTKPSQAESRATPIEDSPNNLSGEQFTDLISLAKSGYAQPLWRQTIGTVLAKQYPDVFGPNAPG